MFRSQTNHKIGVLLNYLSTKIPNLSVTKMLKLLYLIDETAYTRSGAPITWLDYKVWEMGPVAEEVYAELKYNQKLVKNNTPINLDNYITTQKKVGDNGVELITIYPNNTYNLDNFSEFEAELIDNIIDRFGSYSATELIKLLHAENSLWHKKVQNHNLDNNFKLYGKKSNHTLDFSELIVNDPILQMAAQASYESMQLQEELNNM